MVLQVMSETRGRPVMPASTTAHFGAWLRAARLRKGWSGERLAMEIQTSQGMISAYERGARFPHRERAVDLATALGADPQDALKALMADTPGLGESPEPERIVSDEEWELVQAFRGLQGPIRRNFKGFLLSATEVTGDEPKEELVYGRGPIKGRDID